ncbi:MAG: type 4a pilus biogenesis protein PilO [Patescibacteria group bacterium]|nr:type 4a pilus biogenesis protein PilO [Patescibacteria group bacterium]
MVEKKGNDIKEYKYPLAVIGGATLIAVLVIFLFGKPLFESMQQTSKELTERRDVLAKLEVKLDNLKSLQSREEELKRDNEVVLAALPESKDVSRLFVQFESLARESGLTIDSVSEAGAGNATSTTTVSGGISPVSYQVSGNAKNYSALKKTLTNMEDALRLLSISSINANLSSGSLSTDFTINTYVRNSQ